MSKMGLRVKNIEVGNRIGEASKFRIYSGKTDSGEQVILKVAKTFEDGDILAEEASEFNILRTFETQVALLEEQQGHTSSHYDWLFANLSSSFMEATQEDRRINVFTIPDIDLSKLIPLTKLHSEIEIDARTSVWILGRFLKFYSFFELLAASGDNPIARYPLFSPDEYLIGPEKHRLIYYNFSGDMADVVAFDFIKAVVKFVLDWTIIGDDSAEQRYFDLLKDFSKHGRDSFEEAHGDLYKKHRFQGHELDKAKMAKELGDVSWYLALTAYAIGYNLEDIFKMNIEKLRARYPDGFDADHSLHRQPGDI